MHDLARRDATRRQLPQFLDADAVGLRVAVGIELVLPDQLFRQMPATAFGEHGDGCDDIDALRIRGLVRTVFRDAHIADAHTAHRASVVEQRLGCGEARVYFHAERLGLRREPCAQRAERDDHIAVIVHLRRGQWQLETLRRTAQPPHFILRHRHADRRRIFAPGRQEFIERLRFYHRTRQNLCTDGGGLFDHAHTQVRLELLGADRESKSGGAGADGDDVVLHHIAGGRFGGTHARFPVGSAARAAHN